LYITSSTTCIIFSLLTAPPPTSPLFPYTTLFRSSALVGERFGQVVDQVRDVGRAFELEFLLADGGDRAGRVDAGLRNARTRDHHGFDIAASLLRGGGSDAEHGGGRCSEEQGGTQIAGIFVGLEHLEPPWFCR